MRASPGRLRGTTTRSTNYAGDEGSYPQGGFLNRRADAYQAFYEHQPLRARAIPEGPDILLYRQLVYGDLAQFSVLDTRQYRSDQPCGSRSAFGASEAPRCAEAFETTMTGPDQERWLLGQLDRSNTRWNVVAQQVLMAQLDHLAGPEEVFWTDSWDGYPAARNRILGHLADGHVSNPVVITGDWHSTFVNDLRADFTKPSSPVVATEFVGTSISSGGDVSGDAGYHRYYGPKVALPENDHIKFFNGDRRGYVRCRVNPTQWQTDLRMVETVSRPDAPIETYASFVVEDGRPGAQCAGGECMHGRIGRQ